MKQMRRFSAGALTLMLVMALTPLSAAAETFSTDLESITINGAEQVTGDAFNELQVYDIINGTHNQNLNELYAFRTDGPCMVRKDRESGGSYDIVRMKPYSEWDGTSIMNVAESVESSYGVEYTLSPGIYVITLLVDAIPFGPRTYDVCVIEVTGYETTQPDTPDTPDSPDSPAAPAATVTPPVTPAVPANTISTASEWAKAGITEAIGKGYVPADLQNNYKNTITRAEFCALAVTRYEGINGEITGRKTFTDTQDVNVQKAASVGIVSGTNAAGTIFSPNAPLTREQAATMLVNLCKTLGKDVSNAPASGFADMSAASAYAVNNINFCAANGIMNGTSATTFGPKATYTREQSIITFNNLNPDAL